LIIAAGENSRSWFYVSVHLDLHVVLRVQQSPLATSRRPAGFISVAPFSLLVSLDDAAPNPTIFSFFDMVSFNISDLITVNLEELSISSSFYSPDANTVYLCGAARSAMWEFFGIDLMSDSPLPVPTGLLCGGIVQFIPSRHQVLMTYDVSGSSQLLFIQVSKSGFTLVPKPLLVSNATYATNLYASNNFAIYAGHDSQDQSQSYIYQLAVGNGAGQVLDKLKLPYQLAPFEVSSANNQQIQVSEQAGIFVILLGGPDSDVLLIGSFDKN